MTKHKLLVIGAGIGQIPIVKLAKQRDIHVTVVTMPGNCPASQFADEVFYHDIYDRDSIVDYAKANGITAVTSDQNDLMMPTVAYVAEKCGLPGNAFDQVWAYCCKNVYRDNCVKIGNPVPRYTAVSQAVYPEALRDQPFPWIVKPEDSQSSVGVTKIDNESQLIPAIDFALSKSKTHRAIVEEFFKGHEVVCEGFIYHGKYYLLSFADRKYFKLDNLMIPSQTLFPSVIAQELRDRIVSYEAKMAEYINLQFAIVHSEYLVNLENHEIRVVESAPRGGGVFISSHLIPMATGINVNELLIDCALGIEQDVEKQLLKNVHHAAAYVCFYLPEGVITSIDGAEAIQKLPFVKMACLDTIQKGVKTEPMLHKGMRKGPILISGKDREEIERNINIVQGMLKIIVKNGEMQTSMIHWN